MEKPKNTVDLDILFQDEFDFKAALKSPFSEPKWWAKLILPALIIFLVIISGFLFEPAAFLGALFMLAAIVLSISYAGFVIEFQHNEIRGKLPLLPCLKGNLKRFALLAIKNWVIALVYILAIDFIGLIMFAGGSLGGVGFVLIPLGILAIIPIFCMLILAYGIFADTYCIKTALDFKKAFALVRQVKLEIFMLFLFLISLSVMVHISIFVLAITIAGLAFVPFVLVLQLLIGANTCAQLYKIAKCRLSELKS